ncbi:MAG: hypothetical protein ACHQT9_03220 [Candidatus Saccharimonadales bacterium]
MYTLSAFVETRTTHQQLQAESPVIPDDPEATAKLAFYFANKRVAASGIVGSTLYDIAHDGIDIDAHDRRDVAVASSRMSLVQDLMDMIVDTDMAEASDSERFGFMNTGLGVLLGAQPDTEARPLRQRATLHAAKLLHDTMIGRDTTGSSSEVLHELVAVAQEQLIATEPSQQLDAAQHLGASCCEAIAVFPEIVDGTSYPFMRKVARHMGAYSEILDHLYEIDEDIAEGATTYATLRLAEEGDTPATRKDIHTDMLNEASRVRRAIMPELSPYQRRRYNGMLNLAVFKYRVANWRRMKAARLSPTTNGAEQLVGV